MNKLFVAFIKLYLNSLFPSQLSWLKKKYIYDFTRIKTLNGNVVCDSNYSISKFVASITAGWTIKPCDACQYRVNPIHSLETPILNTGTDCGSQIFRTSEFNLKKFQLCWLRGFLVFYFRWRLAFSSIDSFHKWWFVSFFVLCLLWIVPWVP